MRIGVGTQFALSVFSWWLVSSANVWASPDGDCIVAAAARDTRVADAQTLLMADDQRLYRVDLAQTCPALLELHSISLRAREGRLCGSRGEAVIANGEICEVARVIPIEASEYAQRAGMSETQLAVELPPRGIAATTRHDRCHSATFAAQFHQWEILFRPQSGDGLAID